MPFFCLASWKPAASATIIKVEKLPLEHSCHPGITNGLGSHSMHVGCIVVQTKQKPTTYPMLCLFITLILVSVQWRALAAKASDPGEFTSSFLILCLHISLTDPPGARELGKMSV